MSKSQRFYRSPFSTMVTVREWPKVNCKDKSKASTRRKYTPQDILFIYLCRAHGMKYPEIGAQFLVTPERMRQIFWRTYNRMPEKVSQ